MQREAMLQDPFLEALALAQRGLTALSSAFNTLFFASYRSATGRRRWGVLALFLVNLAFLVQALYFGLLPYLLGLDLYALSLDPRLRLLAGAFPLAASLLITLLVVRQLLARRRR